MPRIPFFIAKRYLFSKKSTQAINIIAWVSLVGFAIGVFAMIVVLSTMNGFEKLVFGMYNDFSPDIKATPKTGKVININQQLESYLEDNNIQFTRTLEENAACNYAGFQHIVRVKGVEPAFLKHSNLENHLVDGELSAFEAEDSFFALLGLGVDYKLATRIEDPNCIVEVNAPRRGDYNLQSLEAIRQERIKPLGIFAYDDAINNKYILVNLAFAQELFERGEGFSAYEINSKDENLIDDLRNEFGSSLEFKTRYQLHEGLFKMFKTEKWFTFIILAFVLLIISFNLTGSLSLLVIEKKKDIKTFKSIGMTAKQVRKIFFLEGLLIVTVGALVGLGIGLLCTWAQIRYGVIKISGAIVESYPMHIKWLDVILCLLVVLGIGIVSSIYPAVKAGKYHA